MAYQLSENERIAFKKAIAKSYNELLAQGIYPSAAKIVLDLSNNGINTTVPTVYSYLKRINLKRINKR